MTITLPSTSIKAKYLRTIPVSSVYQDLLDEKEMKYHEIHDTFYLLHSGIVFPFKKKYYPTADAALSDLEKVVDNLFKDSKMLQKMMHRKNHFGRK